MLVVFVFVMFPNVPVFHFSKWLKCKQFLGTIGAVQNSKSTSYSVCGSVVFILSKIVGRTRHGTKRVVARHGFK